MGGQIVLLTPSVPFIFLLFNAQKFIFHQILPFIFLKIFIVSAFLSFIPISLPKTKVLLNIPTFLLVAWTIAVTFDFFCKQNKNQSKQKAIWKDYLPLIYSPQQPETVAIELLFWLHSCKKTVNSPISCLLVITNRLFAYWNRVFVITNKCKVITRGSLVTTIGL